MIACGTLPSMESLTAWREPILRFAAARHHVDCVDSCHRGIRGHKPGEWSRVAWVDWLARQIAQLLPNRTAAAFQRQDGDRVAEIARPRKT